MTPKRIRLIAHEIRREIQTPGGRAMADELDEHALEVEAFWNPRKPVSVITELARMAERNKQA